MKPTGEPTWIPSAERRLAATVHGPVSGAARGVIVLVGPVGRDRAVTYRGLRFLAARAAEAGFIAVRFDLSGTGESSPATGIEDPQAPTSRQWSEDLDAVLDWCQRTWGVRRVAGIGLLLGGALLGAAEDPRWSVRLLWDQTAGKRFLRQGAMLRMMSVPGRPRTDGVEHPGAWYPPARAAEIAALTRVNAPVEADPAASSLMLRVDSGEEEARSFHGVASLLSQVPTARIGKILRLIEAHEDRLDLPAGEFRPEPEAEFTGPGGRRLIERIVASEDGLYGTLTQPAPAEPARAEVDDAAGSAAEAAADSVAAGEEARPVLLVAAASEPKDGPTGLWVHAARVLAEQGATVLRPERPGCGELADTMAQHEANPHTAQIVAAVQNAARWLTGQTGRPVLGVGLCSGAWAVLSAAEEPLFDEVLAVNNLAWRTDLDFHARLYDEGLLNILPEAEELKVVEPEPQEPVKPGRLDLAHRRTQAKDALRRFLQGPAPYGWWRWIGSRGLADVPEILLRRVAPDTRVEVIFGQEDWPRFEQYRGPEGVRRVDRVRPAPARVASEPALDHSLLSDTGRRRVLELITRAARTSGPAADRRP